MALAPARWNSSSSHPSSTATLAAVITGQIVYRVSTGAALRWLFWSTAMLMRRLLARVGWSKVGARSGQLAVQVIIADVKQLPAERVVQLVNARVPPVAIQPVLQIG